MLDIPLAAVPNQTFSVRLDDSFYDIAIHLCEGLFPATAIMAVDIVRDGVAIVTGQRVVAGLPVIPYRYLEKGNFLFLTEDDELPYWEEFGITQFLIYASPAELEVLYGGT